MDLPTADLAPDAIPSDAALIPQAIEAYDRGARVGIDAIEEYNRHLKSFSTNFSTYQSHIAECRANAALLKADRDYLKAMLANSDARKHLLATSADEYRAAANLLYPLIFQFYIDDELAAVAFPQGLRRTNVDQMPPALYPAVYKRVLIAAKQRQLATGYDPTQEDRLPYEHAIDRTQSRLNRLAPPPH
jgi:hypothetical protein